LNILLFSSHDKISSNTIRVSDYRYEHMQKRQLNSSAPELSKGSRLRIGEINGYIGLGFITAVTHKYLEIEIESLNDNPPPPTDVTLIIALPRPKMLKRIFREATTLGIKDFYIINSYKVDKSYWKSPSLAEDKLNHYLREGLEQCIDTRMPKITLNNRFKPFIEDELPQLIEGKETFIAHPDENALCPTSIPTPSAIAIGPEGGFTDYEVNKFREAGFQGITLGKRILKVETAISVLAGRCI